MTLTSSTRCHSSSSFVADVADGTDARVVDDDVDAAEASRPRSRSRHATDAGSATSHGTSSRCPGRPPCTSGRAPPLARRGRRSNAAVAAPMPLAPPVTTATSPSKSFMSWLPSRVGYRRGSMWIFGPSPAPGGRQPASTSPTSIEPDGRGDQRTGVDRAGGVGLDGAGQARPTPPGCRRR